MHEFAFAAVNPARCYSVLKFLLAFICLLVGLVGWEESAGLRGHLRARLDVARGHYEIPEAAYQPRLNPNITDCCRNDMVFTDIFTESMYDADWMWKSRKAAERR